MLEAIEIPGRVHSLEVGPFRRQRFERDDGVGERRLVCRAGDRRET